MTLLSTTTRIAGAMLVISLACTFQFGCSRGAQHYLDKGNRFFADSKYDDANLQYRKAISKNPKSAEAHYRLALSETKLGRLANAFQELGQAVQLRPDSAEYRVQLADMALSVYDANRGSKVVYEQIASAADFLLKQDPKSFDGLRLRGDVLSIDGKLSEARAIFTEANSIKPNEPTLVLTFVQVLFRLNETAAAEALAKQCLQAHNTDSAMYDLLADYYVRSARLPEAEAVLKSKAANLPGDVEPLLRLASFYRQARREPEMSATLQKILNHPKDFPRGHLMVGDLYAQAGRGEQALKVYRDGHRLNPKDDLIYRKKIAKILIAQGLRDAALEELNQVVAAHPQDLDGRMARAILLRDGNDPKGLDTAIAELNDLVAKVPQDAVFRLNLGLAYRAKGDEKSARAQLAESAHLDNSYIAPRLVLAEMAQQAQDYSQVIRQTGEVLNLSPDNVEAKLLRISGLIGSNALAQARSQLNALLQQVPGSMAANLNMAVLDALEKKYADAENRYRRLYQAGGKDLRPLEGLVQLYVQQQQVDKAIKLAGQELKLSPDSSPRHRLMASLAARTGKLDLALEQFEWLRAKDPQSVEVHTAIGQVLRLKGDLAGALASYQKARELAPNNAIVVGTVGMLESATGQSQNAVDNLKKQLALDPTDAVAMNNLAYALADQGADLDQALTLAEAAQRKLPNNASVSETLGWVYTRKGLNSSAIQIFSGLLKKYPDDPALRYHLGVALLQSGKPAEAKTELTISLTKKPPKDVADKIQQIISKLG